MRQTTHYKLPLFESSDQPKWLVDWNGAMSKLDTVIHTIATGSPDVPDIDELYGMVQAIDEQINFIKANIAPIFSEDTNYLRDDFVLYQDELYIFQQDYTAGDGWDHALTTQINLADKLSYCLQTIRTLDSRTTSLDSRVTALENATPNPLIPHEGTYTIQELTAFCDYVGSVIYDFAFPSDSVKVNCLQRMYFDNNQLVIKTYFNKTVDPNDNYEPIDTGNTYKLTDLKIDKWVEGVETAVPVSDLIDDDDVILFVPDINFQNPFNVYLQVTGQSQLVMPLPGYLYGVSPNSGDFQPIVWLNGSHPMYPTDVKTLSFDVYNRAQGSITFIRRSTCDVRDDWQNPGKLKAPFEKFSTIKNLSIGVFSSMYGQESKFFVPAPFDTISVQDGNGNTITPVQWWSTDAYDVESNIELRGSFYKVKQEFLQYFSV